MPIRFGEKLFALANPPKDFWRVEGAAHLAMGERLAETLDWIAQTSGDRQGQDFAGHPEPKGNSGGDGDRYGGEFDLHGNRSAEDVQDRAMRVDNRFELRQIPLCSPSSSASRFLALP